MSYETELNDLLEDIYRNVRVMEEQDLKKSRLNLSISEMHLLEQIGKEDIEEYLEYLTYYEKDGQVFTNDARGKARKLSAVRSMFKYFYKSWFYIKTKK